MTKQQAMTLRDLTPGDKFVHAKSNAKNPKRYLVKGNMKYSNRHGSAIRECIDLLTMQVVSKSGRLEVNKIGESLHKQKMIEQAKGK